MSGCRYGVRLNQGLIERINDRRVLGFLHGSIRECLLVMYSPPMQGTCTSWV